MRCSSILFALTFFCSSSWACSGLRSANDSWTGVDKAKHFGVSVAAGALGAYLAKDSRHPVLYGTILGATPGLLKELSDGCRNGGSGFSGKDMAYNLAGAFVGAKIGAMSISYHRRPGGGHAVALGYSQAF